MLLARSPFNLTTVRTVARARFQIVARAVLELERDVYLKGVRTVRENETGQGYIDLVSVEGLTPKGRRYVEGLK